MAQTPTLSKRLIDYDYYEYADRSLNVNITWYGRTCFHLEDANSLSILTDPYPPDTGLSIPELRADIVTISCSDSSRAHTAGVQGPFKLLDGPGEYEIGGVFITAIATFADDREGALRGLNTVFSFDFGGLGVCHLGRLGDIPPQSRVKEVGEVNILLVPVGGGGSLTPAQASEVIGLFDPNIVIPMRYKISSLGEDLGTLDHFLQEMGVDEVNGRESLAVGRSDMSEETQVVVLKPSR